MALNIVPYALYLDGDLVVVERRDTETACEKPVYKSALQKAFSFVSHPISTITQTQTAFDFGKQQVRTVTDHHTRFFTCFGSGERHMRTDSETTSFDAYKDKAKIEEMRQQMQNLNRTSFFTPKF